MKYYCDWCRLVLDKSEVSYVRACIGEAWGIPQYETEMVCPRCKMGGLDELTDEEAEEYNV